MVEDIGPEAVGILAAGERRGMRAEVAEDRGMMRVVTGQVEQDLAHRPDRPAVAARPERKLRRAVRIAGVHVKLRLLIPDLRVETKDLAGRIVEQFVAGLSSAARRDAWTRNGIPMNMSSTQVVYSTGVRRV